MPVKEGYVNFHIVIPDELHQRYTDVTYRQKKLGNRQASINKNAVRALEECIAKIEREIEEAERKAKAGAT